MDQLSDIIKRPDEQPSDDEPSTKKSRFDKAVNHNAQIIYKDSGNNSSSGQGPSNINNANTNTSTNANPNNTNPNPNSSNQTSFNRDKIPSLMALNVDPEMNSSDSNNYGLPPRMIGGDMGWAPGPPPPGGDNWVPPPPMFGPMGPANNGQPPSLLNLNLFGDMPPGPGNWQGPPGSMPPNSNWAGPPGGMPKMPPNSNWPGPPGSMPNNMGANMSGKAITCSLGQLNNQILQNYPCFQVAAIGSRIVTHRNGAIAIAKATASADSIVKVANAPHALKIMRTIPAEGVEVAVATTIGRRTNGDCSWMLCTAMEMKKMTRDKRKHSPNK